MTTTQPSRLKVAAIELALTCFSVDDGPRGMAKTLVRWPRKSPVPAGTARVQQVLVVAIAYQFRSSAMIRPTCKSQPVAQMARFQAVGVLSLTQIAGSVSQVLMPDKRRDSASRGQMLAGGLMLMRAEGSTTFNEPIDPDWFDSEDAARDYLIGIAFTRTLSKVTIKVV